MNIIVALLLARDILHFYTQQGCISTAYTAAYMQRHKNICFKNHTLSLHDILHFYTQQGCISTAYMQSKYFLYTFLKSYIKLAWYIPFLYSKDAYQRHLCKCTELQYQPNVILFLVRCKKNTNEIIIYIFRFPM